MSTEDNIYRMLESLYKQNPRSYRAKRIRDEMERLGLPLGMKLSRLGEILNRMENVERIGRGYVPKLG